MTELTDADSTGSRPSHGVAVELSIDYVLTTEASLDSVVREAALARRPIHRAKRFPEPSDDDHLQGQGRKTQPCAAKGHAAAGDNWNSIFTAKGRIHNLMGDYH